MIVSSSKKKSEEEETWYWYYLRLLMMWCGVFLCLGVCGGVGYGVYVSVTQVYKEPKPQSEID